MDSIVTGDLRRTSADDVFDYLSMQINSLKLLPGTRISEIEIAKQFDVSRQPVREAFIRLANRGLLLIRPQKATVVRKFSNEKVKRARFLRMAVEYEVLRRACRRPLGKTRQKLERSIKAQEKAIKDNDIDRFHMLDYEFHKILCEAGGSEFVFETIAENKAQVDRICLLSLAQNSAMDDLLVDHKKIVAALIAQDEETVTSVIMMHLNRLDDVLAKIRKTHIDFFED
ncbi:GntR family transcriptional regulator [Yoonia sp. 2307UL14-13]|uniref:GntR family transcriptional regulator n=1 Tax=Yoonia sp. 2307UL14-13 TaxID=3126506 RepID=UPI00309DA7EC